MLVPIWKNSRETCRWFEYLYGSAFPRRNGLCSVPIFLCRKISHTRRRSSSFAKRHAQLACSLVNALTTAHSRCNLFARCACGANISMVRHCRFYLLPFHYSLFIWICRFLESNHKRLFRSRSHLFLKVIGENPTNPAYVEIFRRLCFCRRLCEPLG